MSTTRLYVPNYRLSTQVIVLEEDERHYLFNVLRLKDNDTIVVLDGAGNAFKATIEGSSLRIGEKCPTKEPKLRLTLFQFLPKGDKFADVVRMCTELGVFKFVLVYGERSNVRSISENKMYRWSKIAKEAAELSGRGIVPEIIGPYPLYEIPEEIFGKRMVVFWENSNAPISSLIKNDAGEVSVFIGAEGGISPKEVDFLKFKGALVASLGDRILRVETASIVACSLLFYISHDIR